MQDLAGAIQMFDELDQPALVLKRFALAGALVGEDDFDAAVQEGEFLQAAVERVVVELAVAEDLRVGLERGAGAGAIRFADLADLAGRHAAFVFLLIEMAVAADFDFAPFAEKVDDLHADAVQAARGFVGLLVELAAELEPGHHAFERGDAQVGMDFDRNAAAVVGHRDRAIDVDGDRHFVGVAGHGLVDRVVDGFIDHVVQAAQAGVADVHARPFADVLQVGQIFHLTDAVFALDPLHFGHIGLLAGLVGRFF